MMIPIAPILARLDWSGLDWNQPSLDFYASLGAVPQNSWIIHRVVGAPLAALAERWPGTIAKP